MRASDPLQTTQRRGPTLIYLRNLVQQPPEISTFSSDIKPKHQGGGQKTKGKQTRNLAPKTQNPESDVTATRNPM